MLLIEAGGSDRRLSRASAAGGHPAVRHVAGLGLRNRTGARPAPTAGSPCTRGRVLGGTSAMNAHGVGQGQQSRLRRLACCPAGRWTTMAPVFARVEREADAGRPDCRIPTICPPASSPRHVRPVSPPTTTSAGPNSTARRSAPVTIHNGQRWNAARGYLDAPEESDEWSPTPQVRRLNRSQWPSGRCRVPPSRRVARRPFADREVVVSAGALVRRSCCSLSGVGPADHLRSVGITPIVDSPRVGCKASPTTRMRGRSGRSPPVLSACRT